MQLKPLNILSIAVILDSVSVSHGSIYQSINSALTEILFTDWFFYICGVCRGHL